MHPVSDSPVLPTDDGRPWWLLLNRYHWFVFVVASLGWLFDTMDQQLFNIARRPAMLALLPAPAKPVPPEPVADAAPAEQQATYKAQQEEYLRKEDEYKKQYKEYENQVTADSGTATSIFLIGWGVGGILFGILADLLGRVKALTLTILIYSAFTGLSAFATGFKTFALYRFLTGLGVGGEFGVGVALVAETMPERARPFVLGLLQALSAVGNITAAGIQFTLAQLGVENSWRVMFLIGAAPALLTALIIRRLKEPERWKQAAAKYSLRERLGSYFGEIFENPRWSRNAIVGLLLASSGILGLWGIGFFSIDLQRSVFRRTFEQAGLSPADVNTLVDRWAALTSLMLNVGAFFGMYAFSLLTSRLGRKPVFAMAFPLALVSTAFVFWNFQTPVDVFWMIPLMGFCQLALFGGYAIYFPELFPTRLRGTGTSFCYNGARFVAALGPLALGFLTSRVFAHNPEPFRNAGVAMCAVFLIGLFVLPFAPETKGQPLPE